MKFRGLCAETNSYLKRSSVPGKCVSVALISAQRCLSAWSDTTCGKRVEARGQGLGFFIGNEIDLGAVDGAQQTASIIMAAHRLAYDLRHGPLGSIGDHFDRVGEVLGLRAQAIEAA
jgi:hypothetical protein